MVVRPPWSVLPTVCPALRTRIGESAQDLAACPQTERQSARPSPCPRPCFATNHVPIVANIAMTIPEGMVVLLVPDPLVEAKSGPQTAAIATAIHIAKIASDAQVSTTRTCVQRRASDGIPVGGCGMVDISHTSLPPEHRRGRRERHRGRPRRRCPELLPAVEPGSQSRVEQRTQRGNDVLGAEGSEFLVQAWARHPDGQHPGT